MRAAGYPPKIIRAIIAAQINDLMAARRQALAEKNVTLPPTGAANSATSTRRPRGRVSMRSFWKEQRKMMSDLLGPDGDPV